MTVFLKYILPFENNLLFLDVTIFVHRFYGLKEVLHRLLYCVSSILFWLLGLCFSVLHYCFKWHLIQLVFKNRNNAIMM